MFEYLTEHVNALTDDYLNELGRRGWQLVTIYDDVAYFIKPVPMFDRLAAKDQIVVTDEMVFIPADEWTDLN